jgi:hypothetical protein
MASSNQIPRLTLQESATYNTAHARKADAEQPQVAGCFRAAIFCIGDCFLIGAQARVIPGEEIAYGDKHL